MPKLIGEYLSRATRPEKVLVYQYPGDPLRDKVFEAVEAKEGKCYQPDWSLKTIESNCGEYPDGASNWPLFYEVVVAAISGKRSWPGLKWRVRQYREKQVKA